MDRSFLIGNRDKDQAAAVAVGISGFKLMGGPLHTLVRDVLARQAAS